MIDLAPAKAVEQLKDDFLILKTDLENPKQVDLVVEYIVGKFRKLDILINNAGYTG